MSKVDILRLDSTTANDTAATSTINQNFKKLQDAVENTLSRDGTAPNFMDANLDMNSKRVINVGNPVNDHDAISKKYFEDTIGDAASYATQAQASANAAASSAQASSVSAANALTSSIVAESSADLAKDWATKLGDTVDGVEYSSKYYAQASEGAEENASIWAEGTDLEVQAIGGTHSAKGWVDVLGTVYKPKGSIAFASLPALSADIEGFVYNVTDDFITTADFVEGAGKSYPAGTNAVCVDTGSSVYKWDILGSFIDLSGKQDVLVSGTNIKTINNSTILGSGDLQIDSLPSQTGHAGEFLTTDGTDASWASVSTGRNVGELVYSAMPLTDAGLHLLDGSLISGGGIYDEFVQYVAGLVSGYPDLFVTEASWQAAVSANGVCGKFVYDSSGDGSVRLPKITGIIEGTTSLTALGDLVAAGLPNITGELSNFNRIGVAGINYTESGALSVTAETVNYLGNSSTSDKTIKGIKFDASRSSSIYGNSNTVQPQTIKQLVYIVIANSTKTEIEVDIDQIATDLNGKADVDLVNVTIGSFENVVAQAQSAGKVTVRGWQIPNYDSGVSIAANTDYSCPKDGVVAGSYNGANNGYARLDINTKAVEMVTSESGQRCSSSFYADVKQGDVVRMTTDGSAVIFQCKFYPYQGA